MKMRVTIALLILVMIVLQPSLPLASSISKGEALGVGVHRYRDDPVEGFVIKVSVEVYPGSGRILTNVKGDELFMASLLMACYEAALLAQRNPWSLDFYVKIEAEDNRRLWWITGPSLGLTVFLAAYSALTKTEVKKGLVSTGVVQPDGLIGWVGDIETKAEAVATRGYSELLIPLLQNVTVSVETEYRTFGPYIIETPKIVMKSLGLERLNVSIHQATGVFEVLNIATDLKFEAPSQNLKKLRLAVPESRVLLAHSVMEIYEREIERDLEATLNIIERLRKVIPRQMQESLLNSVSKAKAYLEFSRELKGKGYLIVPFDALALAYYHAKYAKYLAFLAAERDPRHAITEALKVYLVSTWVVRLTPSATPDHLLTLAYCRSLLEEASDYVARIAMVSRLGALNSEYAMYLAANVAFYSLRAQVLALLYFVNAEGMEIPYRELYEASQKVYEYFYTASNYATLYTVEIQSEIRTQALLHLSASRSSAEIGDYPRALVHSLEATGRGLTMIALPIPHDPFRDLRLSTLEENINVEFSKTKRVPLMTFYYLELASLQERPEYRLYYLELALVYLKAYRMLHIASGVGEEFYESFWATALEGLASMTPVEAENISTAVDFQISILSLLAIGIMWRRVRKGAS
ncbi:MAG: hypothetical protein QXV55_04975 [Acidilobaceae archaeon]